MIDSLGRDELVLNKQSWGDLTVIQDVEAQADQVITVPFWKIGDRANQASLRPTEFRASFTGGILSHNGTTFRSACFFKGS